MTTLQVVMTERDARKQMRAIQKKFDAGVTALGQAKEMVEQFDQSEGWRAMGYRSLAACLAKELQVSRQHAYRLLDEVRGRTALLGTPAQANPDAQRTSTRSAAVRTVDPDPEVLEGDVLDDDPGDQANAPSSRVITACELLVDAAQVEFDGISAGLYALNRDTIIAAQQRLTALLTAREG